MRLLQSIDSDMETVRRFMAALGDQNAEGLLDLFASDLRLEFDCQGRTLNERSAGSATRMLLAERGRWRERRIDIKGWQAGHEQIVVRFHVPRGQDIYADYMEYVVRFHVVDCTIRELRLTCQAEFPVTGWELFGECGQGTTPSA